LGIQADDQITAWVDEGLDKNNYIVPGLGDFGDRYAIDDQISTELTIRYFL
jgi:hypothetical protein